MRWHYGLVALLGLFVGWGSVNLVRYLVFQLSPVKVEPSAISLGEVVEGENVPFTVYIINSTAQTLQLTRFHASTCGCFFEQQKLPKTIPPQSKVPLSFGLRTENLPDRFQERLTFVLTNSSGATFTPTVTLTGKVLREIVANPTFLDFGTVLLGGGNYSDLLTAKSHWANFCD